jgi:hypothetical protein
MDTVRSPVLSCVSCTPYSTHTHRHIYISFRRERASQAAQELETPNVQIYQIPFSLSTSSSSTYFLRTKRIRRRRKKKMSIKWQLTRIVLYKDEDWLLRNGKFLRTNRGSIVTIYGRVLRYPKKSRQTGKAALMFSLFLFFVVFLATQRQPKY